MEISFKAFGQFATNCYIIKTKFGEIVIDPGVGAADWVLKTCSNILAVFNTHGHFDHVFDDQILQKNGAKIYIHKDDAFFLKSDPFGILTRNLSADVEFKENDEFEIAQIRFKIHHVPGHTPGSVMIECEDAIFSGDFLFCGSIGRTDFPFSDPAQMRRSLEHAKNFKGEYRLFPGHGATSTLQTEIKNIDYYLKFWF